MSYCNCGFDIGDPRVSRHTENCAGKRIAELEQQLAELREAARTARESLMYVLCDPEGNACIDGSSGDLSVINEALALLQESSE